MSDLGAVILTADQVEVLQNGIRRAEQAEDSRAYHRALCDLAANLTLVLDVAAQALRREQGGR